VNRLALGTVQFGMAYGIANRAGQVPRAEAKRMLDLARASAIDTLDTATAYGDSESCLGEAGTQGFRIVTKLPSVPQGCADIDGWVEREVEASLARLRTRSVYGLLLHRPGELHGHQGSALWRAMQRQQARGTVSKLGVSIYSPHELEPITGTFDLGLVQAPLNLVDRRLHASGWLERLHETGIEVHARSVFLQGLLLLSQAALPSQFSGWGHLWKRWHEWLSDSRVTPVQACLAFCLGFPEVERVVVGAQDRAQLEQIVAAANDAKALDLPDLGSDAEALIDPSRWAAS
jgi:aryl-alcohol dehydrogenase-like predicted oxidoreductase